MYLLDTVVLSELRKTVRNPGVSAWIADKKDSELFLSVISIGEIARGIERQTRQAPDFAGRLQLWLERLLFVYRDRILPVDIQTARRWGLLSSQVGNSGPDILLAATALERDLSIVTRNERHFTATGVQTHNPWV
ncbi:MAG: type II toxin-antitoxin system VapC family toxin [Desulfovibrio sp.]|jgi:predicted nucleic acid-binding protein|nr:type II toxin-antitoxin system VapC family toxin [Desulfovibrio sp.]